LGRGVGRVGVGSSFGPWGVAGGVVVLGGGLGAGRGAGLGLLCLWVCGVEASAGAEWG